MSKAKKEYYDAVYDDYIQSQIEKRYIEELEKQNEELKDENEKLRVYIFNLLNIIDKYDVKEADKQLLLIKNYLR